MSLAGEGVVAIWNGITREGRGDFYDWHMHEHMPERVGIPGFLRGRRWIAEWGEPEFFTLYEAVSVETLAGQDYLNRLNSPTPWTKRATSHFRDVSRAIQRVRYTAGPGVGGHMLTVRMEADDADSFVPAMVQRVLSPLSTMLGIAGVHLCQSNLETSAIETEEKKGREGGTETPGWTLMVETALKEFAESVFETQLARTALEECGARDCGRAGLYRLEYVRTKNAATA
jgi:hypothetical protein